MTDTLWKNVQLKSYYKVFWLIVVRMRIFARPLSCCLLAVLYGKPVLGLHCKCVCTVQCTALCLCVWTLRLTGLLQHLKLSSCVRNLFKEGFVYYMLLYMFLLVCSLFSIAVPFFFTVGYMLPNILYFVSSFLSL